MRLDLAADRVNCLCTTLLLSGDAHRAEELVQATFERTYRSWHKARTGEPRAYARRILLNVRIDGWRRTRGEVVSDAQGRLTDRTREVRLWKAIRHGFA